MAKEQQAKKDLPLYKKNWFQNVIWVIALLIIFLVLRPFMQGDVVEGKAPNFIVETITGETINLEELQGKSVLVHFWATWCPICEIELKRVDKISEDHRVIKIATQSGSNKELLVYAAAKGINPANIVNDSSGKLMQLYGAKAVPANFIIDKDGYIRFIEVGYTTSFGLRVRLWALNWF